MSPRPRKSRNMGDPPRIQGFIPVGNIVSRDREPVIILYEEWEAFRLVDYNSLSHLEAARQMGVSRPTLTRIYDQVRKKLAQAMVEGREIRIEGGYVGFHEDWYRCKNCNEVFSLEPGAEKKCPRCGSEDLIHLNETVRNWQRKRGHGRWRGMAAGYCVCPACGTKVDHEPGRPCNSYVCPNCGETMVRQ